MAYNFQGLKKEFKDVSKFEKRSTEVLTSIGGRSSVFAKGY